MSENQEDKAPVERIAVVFVHGQGQQTPMTDVIELAHSIWRSDSNAAGGADLAPVYSVPVYDGAASDQRRIITQEVSFAGRRLKVDFYQFYWADLMQGNRFTELWNWFAGLLARDPRKDAIPRPLKPLRDLAMGVAFAVASWSGLLGLTTSLAFAEGGRPRDPWIALGWAGLILGLFALQAGVALILALTDRTTVGHGPLWAAALAKLGAWFIALPAILIAGLAVFGLGVAATGCGLSVRNAIALLLSTASVIVLVVLFFPKQRIWAFTLGLVLLAFCCTLAPVLAFVGPAAAPLFPQASLVEDYALGATLIPAGGLGLIFRWLSNNFLVPVMTESARLFSPSPSNIPNQDRIRRRGLELLETLHGEEAGYGRIVFLAHSLGTAVTYSLLTYYWGKVFETLDHESTQPQREEVERAAAALLTTAPKTSKDSFLRWREAVRDYGQALSSKHGKPSRWRITDFITIGSPLTYASLLLETSDEAFLEQVRTFRRYATCPPQSLTSPDQPYTFTLSGEPHHAALFAATCWTNLFFPNMGIVWGDIIGGKIAGELQPDPLSGRPARLGYGVLDVALPHDRKLGAFTHNGYWPWRDGKAGKTPPQHIQALRCAFHFFESSKAADSFLLE